MHGILKTVNLGDLHFGNPRIDANAEYLKLRKFVYPELKDAHLVQVTGDIYDQLLTVNSKAHRFASMFVSDLFNISAKTGMQVRILHGTYTHDRDQLSIFETLAVPKARFKIVNAIECEEITDLRCGMEELNMKLRVAYLPDNLPYKRSEEAVEHLKRVMTVLGWTQVDMIVGHGTFSHVIPPDSGHRPPCLYTIEQFQSIVPNGPIIMGHIHTAGRKRNVYYCGSFERMSHGEEESKGFYVFTRDAAGKEGWRSRFIENTLATLFISITPVGEDIPSLTNSFITQVDEKFPTRKGHVRVLHNSPEVRSLLHKVCAQQFPDLIYSSKSTGEKEITSMKVDEITLDIFDDVKPDVHNLGDLVYQYLEEKNAVDNIPKELIVEKTKALLPAR